MTVAPGTRLGPYEITAKLGEGGMGEVYRAHDTKLDRDVAIKVLPAAFVEDRERLARFEREAKLLAQLHHPRIASIFGMEETGGASALVMELVEGPTLAERLERGPLALDESLTLARQISEALEEAHQKGIIHRDLKPQNIKVTADGAVKVLDFGLAKAMDPATASAAPSASQLAASPTLTLGATQMGIVLGTAAYMSPEQAKGFAVDKRADIWAFGVVLYEMLCGASPFVGDSVADTLARVLQRDVDFEALPTSTPPAIRRLLRRSLERNPKNRLHDIADARLVIDDVLAGCADAASEAAAPAAATARLPWFVAAGALALGVIGTLAVVSWLSRNPAASPGGATRTTIRLPPALEPDDSNRPIALSPDGSRLVVAAQDAEGVRSLALRELRDLRVEPLAGTTGATYPFWSPDGRSIGFFAGGKLRRLDLASGGVRTLCDAPQGRGAAWGPRDTIVFSPGATGPLAEVSADGGPPSQLVPTVRDGEGQRNPHYLPDGRSVLFFALNRGKQEERAVYVFDAGRGETRKILDSMSEAVFVAPGYLGFVADGNLMLQAFDARRFELGGSPHAIATDVKYNTLRFWIAADLSPAGTLVYEQAAAARPYAMAWLDAEGKEDPAWNGTLDLELAAAAVSPDGKRAAIEWSGPGHGVENGILDFAAGTRSRLGVPTGRALMPTWSPDGERLAVRQLIDGEFQLAWILPHADAPPHPLTSGTGMASQPGSFTPDGRAVLFSRWSEADQLGDIFETDLEGGAPPRPVLTGPGQEADPKLSPSARWMAFLSGTQGHPEVWVTEYPAATGRWQLSSDAADWSFGGDAWGWLGEDELWWESGRGQVVAAKIRQSGREIEVVARRLLLGGRALTEDEEIFDYSPARSRFLLGRRIGAREAPELVLVSDWRAAFHAAEAKP